MTIDQNLTFLQYCSNDELKTLCDTLTHNNKGEVLLNEQLTDCEAYLHNYPENMRSMWQEIAAELQRFGGNTFANIFRGGVGASYDSILRDVCKKIKVRIPSCSSVEEIKVALLTKYCEETIGCMDIELLRELSLEIGVKPQSYNKQVVAAAILLALRKGGGKILGPVIPYIGVNITRILIGRGVYFATAGVLGRAAAALTGPVGWALTAGWLAYDIASPAYRVTVPAVIQVACMRLKYNSHLLTA